jgi:hypothetical protein
MLFYNVRMNNGIVFFEKAADLPQALLGAQNQYLSLAINAMPFQTGPNALLLGWMYPVSYSSSSIVESRVPQSNVPPAQ